MVVEMLSENGCLCSGVTMLCGILQQSRKRDIDLLQAVNGLRKVGK